MPQPVSNGHSSAAPTVCGGTSRFHPIEPKPAAPTESEEAEEPKTNEEAEAAVAKLMLGFLRQEAESDETYEQDTHDYDEQTISGWLKVYDAEADDWAFFGPILYTEAFYFVPHYMGTKDNLPYEGLLEIMDGEIPPNIDDFITRRKENESLKAENQILKAENEKLLKPPEGEEYPFVRWMRALDDMAEHVLKDLEPDERQQLRVRLLAAC